MGKICSICQRKIEEDDVFYCPGCGTKLHLQEEYNCLNCGQENERDALFCKKCGSSLTEQTSVAATIALQSKPQAVQQAKTQVLNYAKRIKAWAYSYRYANIVIGVIIVGLLSILGSYIYFNYVNESRYLARFNEASRKISSANDVLTSNITPDIVKSTQIDSISQQIQEQKVEIDTLEKDFAEKKSPEKYRDQHKIMINLLGLESSILKDASLILTNPLTAETDSLLVSIKGNIDGAEGMANQIQISSDNVRLSTNMVALPHQLTVYVEEKRRVNKERMDRLAAMNKFFTSMDAIIQKYNNAKTDFVGTLENLRKGGDNWDDYFSALGDAKKIRVSLRNQVSSIKAPREAEALKRQFNEVLTQSINYCDMMNDAANMEHSTIFYVAQPKYKEAANANDDVQKAYSAFITNYEAEKSRLTNIDNYK